MSLANVAGQILTQKTQSKQRKPKKPTTEIQLVERTEEAVKPQMALDMASTLKKQIPYFKKPKLPDSIRLSSSSSSSSSSSCSDSESVTKSSKKKRKYDDKPIEVDLTKIPGNVSKSNAQNFDDRDAFTVSTNLIYFTIPTGKGRLGHFRKYWFKDNRPQISNSGGDVSKEQIPGLIDWLLRTYENWDK